MTASPNPRKTGVALLAAAAVASLVILVLAWGMGR